MFMENRENVRQRDSCFPNKKFAYSERSMLCSDDFLKAADWTAFRKSSLDRSIGARASALE
jgi:hypothetical protein